MFAKRIITACILSLFLITQAFAVDAVYLKKNDLQPYYYAQVVDSSGTPVNIAGATIYCTMKLISAGTVKINRQTTGINITDAANGKFEYRWQTGALTKDTDTVGQYSIEFEINPAAGGKWTVPANKHAIVNIMDSLDTQ